VPSHFKRSLQITFWEKADHYLSISRSTDWT
jgi:hypothetical protein